MRFFGRENADHSVKCRLAAINPLLCYASRLCFAAAGPEMRTKGKCYTTSFSLEQFIWCTGSTRPRERTRVFQLGDDLVPDLSQRRAVPTVKAQSTNVKNSKRLLSMEVKGEIKTRQSGDGEADNKKKRGIERGKQLNSFVRNEMTE